MCYKIWGQENLHCKTHWDCFNVPTQLSWRLESHNSHFSRRQRLEIDCMLASGPFCPHHLWGSLLELQRDNGTKHCILNHRRDSVLQENGPSPLWKEPYLSKLSEPGLPTLNFAISVPCHGFWSLLKWMTHSYPMKLICCGGIVSFLIFLFLSFGSLFCFCGFWGMCL